MRIYWSVVLFLLIATGVQAKPPQCSLIVQSTLPVAKYCECPETGVCSCSAITCTCIGCATHVAYPPGKWTYDPLAGGYWMPAGGDWWHFVPNKPVAGYPRASNPIELRGGCAGGR